MKIPALLFMIVAVAFCQAPLQATTSQLWPNGGEDWDPQTSRLKDFTNVGYMNGTVAIPDWPVGVDVTQPPYNAVPDDDIDDSQAFIDAIADCPDNHAVFVPKGKYVMLQRISIDRDYVVLRGEDMFETVLFYPKNVNEIYIEEVGYENPDYFQQGNGFRNVGGKPFILMPGGTHRSIENLTIQFRDQIKMGHWEHKGNDAIRHSGTHSWIKNLQVVNGDHGISTSGGQYITVRNIIFDDFIDRNKIAIEAEGSKVGHMAMHLNDTDDNLYHNILMTGDWSHEFDVKRTVGVVLSDVKTQSNVVAYHGQGVKENLYTNLETGDVAGQIGSDNPFNETYWGVYSRDGDLSTEDAQFAYDQAADDHIYVGYDIDAAILPTKIDPDFWYEAIDPAQLTPLNIYLAQLAKLGKPVPDSPVLQVPNPYTGDVIRIKAVENNTVSAGTPDTPDDPLQHTLSLTDDSYLKFDLSPVDLASIHRVRLRLAASQFQNTPVELGVFSVADDSWAAESLTYNNRKPPVDLLDSYVVDEDTGALVMEFDVTSFVQDEWANDSSKLVSFNISRLSGNGSLSGLSSLNNGFGPILIIEQVPAAEPGAPTAPAEVRATSLIGNIQLDWPDSPESDVVTYNVYRSYESGDFSQYGFPIGMGLTTSDFVDVQDKHYQGWDIGMVRDDIPYFYRVTAVDEYGNESESSLEVIASAKGYADESLPPAFNVEPVILPAATQYLPYADSLAASATDPEGDTLYYAKLNGPDWLEIAPDGTVTAAPREGDTGTYEFTVVVSALSGGHDEATVVITVDAAVPDAPQFVDILPGDGSVELDWSHDAEGSSNFTFSVYRSEGGGPYNEVVSALTASAYTDSGLSNGVTYAYLVTASNTSGESPVSEVRSVTPIAGFSVGTNYIGGGLITDPGSWDNGLPVGQWGRIDVDASFDSSIDLDGYTVLHTGGTLSQTGLTALTLINGSQWITEGDTASTASGFRGFKVQSGSSFTLHDGTINTGGGRDWALADAGSTIEIYGGTVNLGRHLQLSGSAGPVFNIDGGTINGNLSSGYMGGNSFSNNAKTLHFNGGTTTLKTIELSGDNTSFQFGGDTTGSLGAESIGGFGANSAIDFLPGSLMSLSVGSSATWAEDAWNAGNLTYNRQGTATLGSWATVTAADGLEPGIRFVFDGATGTLSLDGVAGPNQPPTFSVDPIERSDALEAAAYGGSIAGDATDPESDTLTFSRLSGPSWLSVAADGSLSGTPSSADTGLNSFQVQVSDGNGGSDSATLEITVENINDAPVFGSDPVTTGAAAEDTAYGDTLFGSATDQDGDALTYTKTAGPAWLMVDPLGPLSGTPSNDDVGPNSFTIEVSDGNGGTASATLEIAVANVNDAPLFVGGPIAASAAMEEAAYGDSIAGSATDDDDDSLSYSKTGGPAWLSVATDGSLSGTPGNDDVGPNSFTVEVSDGNGGNDSATLEITVVNVNDAPVFDADPMVAPNATENTIYTASLAGTATDVDGDNLAYSKTSGPDWLSVAADGDLHGTPDSGDLGLNTFTVGVSDAYGGSDSAVLEITVEAGSPPTDFTDADVNDSLISNPGNWSDGLPTGGVLGTIAINARHDSNFTHEGYHVVHTDGVITKTGFGGLMLGTGTIWEMDGASAQLSSTRGMKLTGATFIMNQGTVDLTENNKDSVLDTGGELIMNGGTMDVGRSLIFNGGDFTIAGGVLGIGSDIGSKNFHQGGTANFIGGTVTGRYLMFGSDSFAVNVGGTAPGTLTVENFGGGRADADLIAINFEAGTEVSIQLTNPVESGVSGGDGDLGWSKVGSETGLPWAEALWADGRLTYKGDDYTTLGSWATVTSSGLGDNYAFSFDSLTNTLSLDRLNQPPAFTTDPVVAADATEDAVYGESIASSATDPNAEDTLSYTLTDGPAWLGVATDGTLSGTPTNADVGVNAFTVEVSDGSGATDTATLEIIVNNVNDAPTWSNDPITGSNAAEDVAYSGSIASEAGDVDAGDTLTFAKVDGPAWLSVATDGGLSGTPVNSDAGLNAFTVSVSDGTAVVETTLEITVDPDGTAPATPLNLQASAGDSLVELTWDANSEADLGGYTVYRSETEGGPYTEITADVSTNAYDDGSVVNGTTYYYVVTASDDNGNESAYSAEVSATPVSNQIITVAEYPFDGSSSASVDTDLNTTASALFEGGGLNSSYDTRSFGERGNPVPSIKWTHGDMDDATVLDGDYLGFTVTADTDEITLGELSFDFSGDSLDIHLFTDEAGFTDVADAVTVFTVTSGLNNYVLPLDALADLAVGETREFRLYFESDGTSWSGAEVWIDNVEMTAEIAGAVPSVSPKLATVTLTGISDSWTTVNLQETYNSPVVVATVVQPDSAQAPVVTRVRNVGPDSFELRVQNPSGAAVGTFDVHVITLEAGVYNALDHGVDIEALTLTSSGTNRKSGWGNAEMEQIVPVNSYTSPVVLGQVMSANDTNWSSFWSSDGSQQNPASAASIYVGKHVGEDPLTSRADETLGVIIVESGAATIEGIHFTASVGSDIVRGVGNGEPFTYSLGGLSSATQAAISAAGMDGGDGGWPVLYGATPVTATSLDLVFDEDQTNDSERKHTTEQVSYIVFE